MVSLSFIYHLRGHAVLQGCIENNKTHIFCYNEASEKDPVERFNGLSGPIKAKKHIRRKR